jgi:hypothetical protein
MRAIAPQSREAFGLGLGNCSADEVVGLRELGELCTCLNFDFDAPLFWENQHRPVGRCPTAVYVEYPRRLRGPPPTVVDTSCRGRDGQGRDGEGTAQMNARP